MTSDKKGQRGRGAEGKALQLILSCSSAPRLPGSSALVTCHLSLVTSKNRAHVLASIAGHLQVAAPGNRTALRRAGDVDAAFPVAHAGALWSAHLLFGKGCVCRHAQFQARQI